MISKFLSGQRSIEGELPYKGIAALKDTAREVRRARNEGILVLGVYTGREEELYAESIFTGKIFLHEKHERLSDIAGMFCGGS